MSIFEKEILQPILNSISVFKTNNAFCINDTYYTYKELGNCISKIRKAIVESGSKSELVGLVINDDLESYAAIFGLWLEGLCYVPLHPGWPVERCKDIIRQIGTDLILDSSEETRYDGVTVIKTTELKTEETFGLTPKEHVSDDNLAYILFTSGSTGTPKGVQLTRKNIGSFMNSFWQTGINITDEDRCLQCFDLTFDVSIQSYLVALTRGACVYTVPSGKIKYVCAAGLIEEYGLTFGAMAPSMLRYLKPYFDEMDATSLKACILTAEACPLTLIDEWRSIATNAEIYDFYGPTECTIYCTYYKLAPRGKVNKTLNGIISIGKPLANCVGLILDENGNELAAGEKGELCIAGDQVTKGYWNNEEKNASSFFIKEVNGVNMRFYHTGDLCYKDEDGDIMYSGRLDQQAKIQGFRVELGEIEYHARAFLKNTNVVCMAYENENQLTQIAMFVESGEFDTNELIAYMRGKMPQYMIPSKILFIPIFPLNSSDKIDRAKLKTMLS